MPTTFDAFSDFRMAGHTAIVTGGAQNIGAGIARTLCSAGAKVMIADLDGDKAAATAAAISAETGGDCRGMACNVTRADDIDAVVRETVAAFGGISTLVNNVGWGGRHEDPTAITDEDFIASYKLNTLSAYRMSMACLPHLLKAENATITNSGSFSSATPRLRHSGLWHRQGGFEPDDGLHRTSPGTQGAGEFGADRHGDDPRLCRRRD